ncbi:MAG: MiaB/RimO family radical SAM methylthiotransferase [Elusimicrobiota bacterium]
MKIFLQTFGCKANQYDTELLRTKMESGGGVSVGRAAEADLCVVNSCSVTAAADKECRQFVRRILRENAHARVVVTGCYASHAPEELRKLSPRVEVYSNREKADLPACLGFEVAPDVFGLTRFTTRVRAFVKIQDGCKAPCKYCIIPQTRPDYWNKPVAQAVKEVRALAAEGHGEIVFTGIRLGLYQGEHEGRKLGLAGLLKILTEAPERFRVRLSSLEVTEIPDEILELAAASPKICRHFHIPLQSADDGVLKDMGRWYAFARYEERVRTIQKLLPDCAVTADVMVGFPTETEEAFQRTHDRIAALGLAGLHVFRYSSRPGTAAAERPPLEPDVVKDRAARLLALSDRLSADFRRRFAGARREAVAEPSGEGWTDNYIRVRVPPEARPGELVPCAVDESWQPAAGTATI